MLLSASHHRRDILSQIFKNWEDLDSQGRRSQAREKGSDKSIRRKGIYARL